MGGDPKRHAGLCRLCNMDPRTCNTVLLIDMKGNGMKYQFDIHHQPTANELIGYCRRRHTWREVAVLATVVTAMLLFIL